MEKNSALNQIDSIKRELNELDLEQVVVDGNILKPSQCYHFGFNPMHVLFNTNCPDSLKQKVNDILAKYITTDESRSFQ